VKTILIMDDNSTFRRLISHTLRRAGYRILSATNGAQGLEIMSEDPVDLVIADLAMPVMDGFAFLKEVRADPRWSKVPVIMLTASGIDQDRVAARAQGANGFLTKPTSSWELVETVKAALQQRPASSETLGGDGLHR